MPAEYRGDVADGQWRRGATRRGRASPATASGSQRHTRHSLTAGRDRRIPLPPGVGRVRDVTGGTGLLAAARHALGWSRRGAYVVGHQRSRTGTRALPRARQHRRERGGRRGCRVRLRRRVAHHPRPRQASHGRSARRRRATLSPRATSPAACAAAHSSSGSPPPQPRGLDPEVNRRLPPGHQNPQPDHQHINQHHPKEITRSPLTHTRHRPARPATPGAGQHNRGQHATLTSTLRVAWWGSRGWS